MTATGNPRAALEACIAAHSLTASAHDRAKAVEMAREALRGHPYPAASLETAACAWEAVLDMEREGVTTGAANDAAEQRSRDIAAIRENIGSSALRLSVLSWVDDIDAAFAVADTDNGKHPMGGMYAGAFDWEFVPDWIIRFIDWSDHARGPVKRQPRDPWDGMAPDLRSYFEALGFQPEMAGGGCMRLEKHFKSGTAVIVTGADGAGIPTADDWAVGTYPPVDGDHAPEAAAMLYSDPNSCLPLAVALSGAFAMAEALGVGANNSPLPAAPAPSLAFDVSFDMPVNAVVRGVESEEQAVAVARALAARIADTNEALNGADYQVPAVTSFSICDLNGSESEVHADLLDE